MPLQSNLYGALAELDRMTRRILTAAGVYLVNKTKDVSSVPAPRRIVGRGIIRNRVVRFYKAKTKAVKGAYPRKLSGRFRMSLAYEVTMFGRQAIGRSYVRVGTNIPYGGKLERQKHEHVTRALREYADEITQVMERVTRR